jgi:hypothetical protein
MLMSARSRAKRRGIPFSIALADIVVPTHCPILGIPLVQHTGKKGSGFDSPSLDAIIPSMGYIQGNVQVISHRANAMKNDATFDEMVKLGKWAAKMVKITR